MRIPTLLLIALAICLIGTAASAQVIHGCIKSNGTLKVVPAPGTCGNNEAPISWNQQGPTGNDGADGQDGMDGADGSDAEVFHVFDSQDREVGVHVGGGFYSANSVVAWIESLGAAVRFNNRTATVFLPTPTVHFTSAGCMGDAWIETGQVGALSVIRAPKSGPAPDRFFYALPESPQTIQSLSTYGGSADCDDHVLTELNVVAAVEVSAAALAAFDSLEPVLYVAPAPLGTP